MKKALSVLLASIIFAGLFRVPAGADEVPISARAYVLWCVNSGEVLLGENIHERLPMASTTKVMTALLTLEEAARDNRVITFTQEMTAEGSSMYLEVGEKLTLRDLAVGMLMQSGNDAANAGAISVSGSYDAFAELMNARAEELGMEDTHFVTPSGLDDDDHYTSAYDMALLLSAAMENEDFRSITSQTEMTVHFTEPSDKVVTYPNHNKLLRLYDGCIGGKTGYTDAAGRCLVTCAERDGLRLVAVTLDDGDDWDDHMALYDYGFARYAALAPDVRTFDVDVVGGTADSIRIAAEPSKSLVIPKESEGSIKTKVYLPPFLYAPVREGEKVGSITYYTKDNVFAEIPLTAADDVAYQS